MAEIRIDRDEAGRPFLRLPPDYEPLELCFGELPDEWALDVVNAVRRMDRAKRRGAKAEPWALAANCWSIEVKPAGAHFEFVLDDGEVLGRCDLPLRDLKRAMTLLIDVRAELAERADRA